MGGLGMDQCRLRRFWFSLFVKITVIILLAGSLAAVNFMAFAADPVVTVTSPTEGQALKTVTPIIYGVADANVTVQVYIDDAFTGESIATEDGTWSFTASLAEGSHSVYGKAVNLDGETGTSNRVSFVVDITPPLVEILNPADKSYINLPMVEGKTEPSISVTVYVYGREATVTADPLGYWFYLDDNLPEGNHNVYAKAEDKAGNEGFSPVNSFVLDMTRPIVSPNFIPPDVMTRVYREQVIWIQVYDNSPLELTYMTTAISVYKVNSFDGIVDTSVNGTVYGKVYFNPDTYEIAFTPQALLDPVTKYCVMINPLLSDVAGNHVSPRSWTFTTMGIDMVENPHGGYTSNVNTCSNCHSPHRGKQQKINSPPNFPDSRFVEVDQIDVYCNACHDGTAAPVPGGWSRAVRHDFQVSIDGTTGTSSCSGCHDPHQTWTPENPNRLQDYYFYVHDDPTNPFLPDTSEDELCESCHDASIKDDSRVGYVRYRYERENTTAGTLEDYSLCLRCHDGVNSVNIAVYYSGPSRHSVTAVDGSLLNGLLACSDCHESHGANNIKLLKSNLGHNNVRSFLSGSAWDVDTERRFCQGCHNNHTELYGITVGFDSAIHGHETTNTDPCSRCHGGSLITAAHAPQ